MKRSVMISVMLVCGTAAGLATAAMHATETNEHGVRSYEQLHGVTACAAVCAAADQLDMSVRAGCGCGDLVTEHGALVRAAGSHAAKHRRALLQDDNVCEPWDIEGSVDVDTAADAESLRGVTSISGSLSIGRTDFENLDFLSTLVCIGSTLYVEGNKALTNLTGLDNLVTVGFGMEINFNDALTSLEGLGNLENVRGADMGIGNNIALASLEGLNALVSVERDLAIYGNDALTSVEGLGSLESIGGQLQITWNDALTSLQGLDSLVSVERDCVLDPEDLIDSAPVNVVEACDN